MSINRIPYFAGIIDADGCISIQRVKGNLSIVVMVSMTNTAAIDLMRGVYGGSLTRVEREGNRKPIYMWKLWAKKAEKLLRDIRPYLTIKAQQADVALSLRDHLREVGPLSRGLHYDPGSSKHREIVAFREAAKAEIHKLNRRGRTDP